uniref:Restriction endonuclease n=1 Tax=Streptomyces sp. NBC_00049 TaxID=2903617 RepID=A0AAU2JX27_9ACTN
MVLEECRSPESDSALGVLLPASALTSHSMADLRVKLSETWHLSTVLYGAGLIPGVHHSFEVAAMFLRKKQEPSDRILRMYRIPRQGDQAAIEKDFEKLLRMQGGEVENGYIVRELTDPREGFNFDRHSPALAARRKDLAAFGSLVTVGELFDRGPSVNVQTLNEKIVSAGQIGAARVLHGRDVLRDGAIAAPDPESELWVQLPAEFLLQPGDLVLRSISRRTDFSLVVSEVTADNLPLAAGHTVIVLRPKVPLASQQLRFTLMFLRSSVARTLLVSADPHVLWRDLSELAVPQPDEALTSALEDLITAKQSLEEWHNEADDILQSIFLDKTPAQARERITQSGRTLRLRVEAADLLDNLGHTVRTRFPYPIALRWRHLEACMSAGNAKEAYEAVLDTAETLLGYSALLVAALAREESIQLNSVRAIRDKLASGRTGPGFGEWVAILEEIVSGRKRKGLAAEHPLNEFGALFTDPETVKARTQLSERRNDQAHQRRPDHVELPSALNSAHADLSTLLDRARFLADLRLAHVTDVRWDELHGLATVDYRSMMGDHPVVPTETMHNGSSKLETDSLYLIDREHRMHLLRPFLIGRPCTDCRTWSTFHVDKFPRGGAVLKSLDHGHTMADPTLGSALSVVGLV